MYNRFRKLVEGSLGIRRVARLAKLGIKKPNHLKHNYSSKISKGLDKRNMVRKLDTHWKWNEIILKNKNHKSDREIEALKHFKYNGMNPYLPIRMSYKDRRRAKKAASRQRTKMFAPNPIEINREPVIRDRYRNQTHFEKSLITNRMKTIKNVKSKENIRRDY